MFNEKFREVLTKEGVVAIVTSAGHTAHVNNTWNSYLRITADNTLLIPVAGMTHTRADLQVNDTIQLTLGSKEVQGTIGPGAGFRIAGHGRILTDGEHVTMMQATFPFAKAVLEVVPTEVVQTI